jgi:hypothetical protein
MLNLKNETLSRVMWDIVRDGKTERYDWRQHKVVYIEQPQNLGLRFVDWADKLSRSIDHLGWYTSDNGDNGEAYRACVFQFPARNGCAQYVPGYARVETFGSRARCEPGYLVALRQRDRHAAQRCDGVDSDTLADCARAADEIARIDAEEECGYQRSWQAGVEYGELVGTIRDLRLERRKLVHNLRRARADFARMGLTGKPWIATLCARLRVDIADLKDTSRAVREKMCKILDESRYGDAAAFNDGAGIDVL